MAKKKADDAATADTHEQALDAICGGQESGEPKMMGAAGGAGAGAALVGVLSELRTGGGFSPFELLGLIPKIVDLIVTYGPVVTEIVKKVKELFGKE